MSVIMVRMEVTLHGLDAPSAQAVADDVLALLSTKYATRYYEDVEVEVTLSANEH